VASTGAAPETLALAVARERVLEAARPRPAERVPLREARGRALREDVIAPHDLPPFRNTSMDGMAIRSADTRVGRAGGNVVLRVVETIRAGQVASRPVEPGEAMRIMTGAPLPEGADAVAPIEDVVLDSDGGGPRASLGRPVEPGANVRAAGADLKAGERALSRGREISPHDVALLAALGVAEVHVGPRPRVAALSTGDELVPAWAPLRPGAIRDSNLPMLVALLEESGALVGEALRCGDDPGEVADAIVRLLEGADVVITIGGVSAGDFDPVKQALDSVGGISLWRVAMKPGRPQAFGSPRGKLFFGLPGNPASVTCVFEALVRPALRNLQGFSELDRPRLAVRVAEAMGSRPGRTDFVRVSLDWREGEWWATPAGPQVSGHVAPQSRAHALLVVPEERVAIERGESAQVLVLRWPSGARS